MRRLLDKEPWFDDWLTRDLPDDEPESEIPIEQPEETEDEMAKVKAKAFVHADQYSTSENPKFLFYSCDMSKYGDVLIGEQEVEVEVPDGFDIRAGLVANLEREKTDLKAAFTKRVTELNAQIQSLLALEA